MTGRFLTAEVRFIMQGEVRILLLQLTGIPDQPVLAELVDQAIELGRSAGSPGSLRTLLDLTGTRISKGVVSSLKRLSRSNGRYAKATAFVGLNVAGSFALGLLLRLTGRTNHRVFRERDAALVWLEHQ